jgi:hypothetical protein
VSGTGVYVGGLIGYGSGTIADSFAGSTVNGLYFVGGLVGWLNAGSMTNSYARGAVSGTALVGGLIGYQSGGSVTGAVWDTQTTGQSATSGVGLRAGGSFTANGYSAAQLQDPATASTVYSGWDFTTIWNAPVAGVAYPTLK